MISHQQEAEILRLYYAEKWPVGTIARQLGYHHTTVRRVLEQAGLTPQMLHARPSIADPYLPLIIETLRVFPDLRASRLHQMAKDRGYPGGPDHFRHVVGRYRPRAPAEAFLRLQTLPGEQAQVDWGHFGHLVVGRAKRALMAFVLVLSFCRLVFLRFFFGSGMASFLAGHVEAFERIGGVPRTLLYDNLKSAVLEREGSAIRFNPEILELAKHYRFAPKPVARARGNQKGRVERAIRYIRDSFFAARTFSDLDDLNAQADIWCATIAAERRHPEDRSKTVGQVYEEERPLLLALPDNPYPDAERCEVHVGKTPYVRFDRNDYSVPHDRVRRTLVVVATRQDVRVLDGATTVATHPRTYDAGARVEAKEHLQRLVDEKRRAKEGHGLQRLSHALPSAQRMLEQAAERNANIGALTAGLLALLDRYGAQRLEPAIVTALAHGTAHLGAVRQLLEQELAKSHQQIPVAVDLPDDPRIKNLTVQPHALSTYDSLKEMNHDDDDSV